MPENANAATTLKELKDKINSNPDYNNKVSRPTKDVFPLSAVILVCKEDASFLPGCLLSLPQGAEVVLAYTVPEQRTDYQAGKSSMFSGNPDLKPYMLGKDIKEMVIKYPADDLNLSDLRNIAAGQATRDFILKLDADERVNIPLEMLGDFYTMKDDIPNGGGIMVNVSNYANTGGESNPWMSSQQVRIYRNGLNFLFHNRIHEVVEDSILAAGYKILYSPISILHLGYHTDDPRVLFKKLDRNNRGMVRDLSEHPDNEYLWGSLWRSLNELVKLKLIKKGTGL